MNIETNRLNTFTNWPASAPVDPIRIAKAGFFYTGEGTEVQCFSCSGKISQWNYGDQVMSRHRQMEPNCVFLVSPQFSGNIPLVLGRECPGESDAGSLSVTIEQPDSTQGAEDYGLTEEDEIYKSDALRLLSFTNWDDPTVSREALVSAGFYHAGEGRLRCAWCGGELAPFRNFGSIGQPLQVHRMYFPRCAHAAALDAAQRATTMSPPVSSPSYTPPIQSPADTTNNQPQSSGAAHNERLLASGGTWRALGVVGGGARHPAHAASAARLETFDRWSSGAAHNERLLASGGTWRALGVVGGGARHPAHAALAARLETFDRWPADRTQTPSALADAGFFYTGTDDQVRCFYCDGGLGKWEAGDSPWREHARWFPHCGLVLLVKGRSFVDECRRGSDCNVQRCLSAESRLSTRRSTGVNFPVTETQMADCMESEPVLAALGAGLDVARVRRAVMRRLRATGLPFTSSEALIDAVLDEQLNEEAWSVSPQSQRLARDILAETLRDFAPRTGLIPSSQEDSSDSRRSDSPSPTPTPNRTPTRNANSQPNLIQFERADSSNTNPTETSRTESNVPENNARGSEKAASSSSGEKKMTLEEENRQLKEARMCKVCMDNEVNVVFLPCGHLVSCSGCGAALAACPLCRCAVRALVRAYLA